MSAPSTMGESSDALKRRIERRYDRRDVEAVESAPVDTIETYDVLACSPWCVPTL